MSSVPRRRRYYEGATTSHPASRSLLVRDRVPRGPPRFVLAEALPGGWRSRPSLGRLVRRRPGSGWRPRGRGGISQVPRRSIPCLCPAPRPRPNQWSLTQAVPPMLPPRPTRRRLQRSHDLEAATGLWHPLPTLRTRRCRRPRKARFRLAGWPLPGEGRTLRIASKGFRALSRRPPFQGLPCRKLGSCLQRPRSQGRRLPPHGRPPSPFCPQRAAELGEVVCAAQRTAATPPLSSNSPVGQRMAASFGIEFPHSIVDGLIEVFRSRGGLVSEVMPLQVAPEHLNIVQLRSVFRQPFARKQWARSARAARGALLVWIGPLSRTRTRGWIATPSV